MKKDVNFYRECLRRELLKPLHKQDFMYMRYLDEIINKLKTNNYAKLVLEPPRSNR